MSRMNRRKLIAGAGALSVTSAIPALSQIDEACNFAWMTGDGLLHASLFAPIPAEASAGHDSASKIDVWTFRVSEIDCSSLPASVGRIIVWDEVFSPRGLRGSVQAMIDAVADWYDFESGTADWSLHIHGFGEISCQVQAAALPGHADGSHRVALIDVTSCGLSRIDWPDILPCLRASYDVVVGFAHVPGRKRLGGEDSCGRRMANVLASCDVALWTNDFLLGFDQAVDCYTRAQPLNALVADLVRLLSAKEPGCRSAEISGSVDRLQGRLHVLSCPTAARMS
ncbi:hypothetical protein ACMA5K_33920 [Bradyrhizobium diazoefficiens]|uniref:hypothetical protein n=1 Tax=Bradyrhizobium diazoefficiens TaxID=1355477 RepID=UPI0015B68C40|nr:hypothetical protein [Bradyrhizobium diazoefficiens]QLD45618.1 hypothetical protein HUW42_33580 [Bradyrhizobium diazoefficiens]